MADDDLGAMLLERCEPGTPLRALSECEQDVVISGFAASFVGPAINTPSLSTFVGFDKILE